MKNIFIVIASLFLFYSANSQVTREWATYYGGSADEDIDAKVVTDASGNVYLSGTSSSSNGIAFNGFQNTLGGGRDVFLAKFDSTGNLVWATYYGGTGTDQAQAIAVDPSGFIYIAGSTVGGPGFASGGFQTVFGGGRDAFLLKFDANGNRIWSTYYGGTSFDDGYGVCVDASANVYLSGTTQSVSGIASGGWDNALGGTTDAFLVKFDNNGNRIWATYYGGTDADYGADVATDGSNNVYLSGAANSTTSIASGGFQNSHAGSTDAFLVKFNSAGSRLWATYYGGLTTESSNTSVITDLSDNVFICGNTMSSGLAAGGFQNTIAGGADAYLVKFNPAGARLWATYYGGTNAEGGEDITTDVAGNVYLIGWTNSSSGIASGGFQNTYGGDYDSYLVKFDTAGNRIFATYYGNTLYDVGLGGTIDPDGNIYLSGHTENITGIASGGYQNTFGGGTNDAFLVKFDACTLAPSTPGSMSGSAIICSGSSNTYSISPVAGATSYTWTLPSGWSGSSTTNSINTTAGSSSGQITVTANNSCGSSTAQTLNVTVNTAPSTPSSIVGSSAVCGGSNQSYSVTNDPSATSYTWTLPSGWSGSSTTNSINTTTGSSSGQVAVTANNSCGSSTSQTLNVTVNPLPTVTLSLNATAVCIDNAVFAFSGGSPAGGTFSGTGVTSGNFNAATAGVGTHTITYTFTDGNGCTNSNTDQITVNNCTGIPDSGSGISDVVIYPNPFTNSISLTGIDAPFDLKLYNQLGEIIAIWQIKDSHKRIDLDNLHVGVYYLQVQNLQVSGTYKIVKK